MRYLLLVLLMVACAPDRLLVVPPDATTPLAAFGDSCDSDEACITGTCRAEYFSEGHGHELPEGLCTYACEFNEDPCYEYGGVCVFEGDYEGICFPDCDAGCREDWVCVFLFTEFCVPESFL